MNTLTFALENIIRSGVLLVAILFQPELRRALEQMGRSKIAGGITGILSSDVSESEAENTEALIEILCKSTKHLAAEKTGALIVVEREIKLGEIIKTGTVIDSKPSVELIANLFFKNAPLHDGAMIIRDGRVYAAGCYLPLSGNMDIGRELGTRHRAGLGMSEVSDAVVIIISEESGNVSAAVESHLNSNLSLDELRHLLRRNMLKQSDNKNEKKPKFRRAKQ
jgi:diadenylate cyclase